MTDVLLVSMPFGPLFAPSLGLSLMKAALAAQGIPSRIHYFTLDYAERVGHAFYAGVASEGRPSIRELAGEWIFSRALFGPGAPGEEERYVDEVLRGGASYMTRSSSRPLAESSIRRIVRARQGAAAFIEACLARVLQERPRVIGFTSVFQQHLASLALARRVKQALPATFVAFGGANCEEVMGAETVRQFPFVDAAVSGEGELVFPALVRRVLEGGAPEGLPGVRTRTTVAEEFTARRFPSAPMVRDMGALPRPDYRDFREQFARSRLSRQWQPRLFFETSRGCWWGERMHCTFCGLNGATMTYRSKSAARAIDELVQLTEEHPGCDVQVVDTILDMGYFQDLLPEMARRRLGLDLFYETKANLKKEQVRLLAQAGIRTIQPGIESLSDSVLRLMRKGVTGLQNLQLLKWCKELGLTPEWNVLWGFPGEPPEEYSRMAELVPLLTHLPPPTGAWDIRMDRFSPNFFDAERLGFADVRPLAPYRYIYPLPDEARHNLAYYFAYRYREPRDVDAYARPLLLRLRAWKRAAPQSDLFSVDVDGRLLVWDLRPSAREPLTVLEGVERLLYQAADAASDLRQLEQRLAQSGVGGLSAEQIEEGLQRPLARRLMLKDGPRYLALAIPLGEYAPAAPVVARFLEVLPSLGKRTREGVLVPVAEPARPPRAPAAAAPSGHARPRGRRGAALRAAQFVARPEGVLVKTAVPR